MNIDFSKWISNMLVSVHGDEKLVKMTNCDTHSYHVLNISTLLISGKDERKAVGAIEELASSHETTSVVMIQIKNPSFLINHPYCCSLTPCRKCHKSGKKKLQKRCQIFLHGFFVECYQMRTVRDFFHKEQAQIGFYIKS